MRICIAHRRTTATPTQNATGDNHHPHEAPTAAESADHHYYHPGTYPSPKQAAPPRASSFHSADHHETSSGAFRPPHPAGAAANNQKCPPMGREQQQQHHPHNHPQHEAVTAADVPDDLSSSTSMVELKRRILMSWALQPPHLQTLRPIGELLATVHHAFPPAHDLPRHDYFDEWQPLPAIIPTRSGGPNDEQQQQQLAKTVRKVRFFLHPDKRPRDLSVSHQYLCQLLWDVINDAYEEYLRVKDELGWMNG
jgi:hypothetical protein